MNKRDLFRAIGDLPDRYWQEALAPFDADTVQPQIEQTVQNTRNTKRQRPIRERQDAVTVSAFGRAVAVAAVVMLLCMSAYGAHKLNEITQMLDDRMPASNVSIADMIEEITVSSTHSDDEETDEPEPIAEGGAVMNLTLAGAPDEQASHFPASYENLSVNNAICEGGGEWYYLVQSENVTRLYASAEGGARRLVAKFTEQIFDMTYYEGAVYLVRAHDGTAELLCIDAQTGAFQQQITLTQSELLAAEMICHCRAVWVSVLTAECAYLRCYAIPNGEIHTIIENAGTHDEPLDWMPVNLAGCGDTIMCVVRDYANQWGEARRLRINAADGSYEAHERFIGKGTFTFDARTVFFSNAQTLRRTDWNHKEGSEHPDWFGGSSFNTVRTDYRYPVLMPADILFLHDDILFFTLFNPYPDNTTELWTDYNGRHWTLPKSEANPDIGTSAAMVGDRVYAVAYDTVYYAEYNSRLHTLGEWQLAYSLTEEG